MQRRIYVRDLRAGAIDSLLPLTSLTVHALICTILMTGSELVRCKPLLRSPVTSSHSWHLTSCSQLNSSVSNERLRLARNISSTTSLNGSCTSEKFRRLKASALFIDSHLEIQLYIASLCTLRNPTRLANASSPRGSFVPHKTNQTLLPELLNVETRVETI